VPDAPGGTVRQEPTGFLISTTVPGVALGPRTKWYTTAMRR
jgi:hypothetical protein